MDFYLTQALAGGFAQYVFTAPEREEIDPYVREGLAAMGAAAHLDLFNRTVAAFGALTDTDVDTYLDGGSGWAAGGDRGRRTDARRTGSPTPCGALKNWTGNSNRSSKQRTSWH